MKSSRQGLAIGCVLLLCAMPAYAYIDPGTGSALIQGLIAAIAAVGITLKLYWHRLVSLVSRKKSKDPQLTPDSNSEQR